MSCKIFGYARVSTADQNLERQLDILKEYGVLDEDVFTDKISGTKLHRPSFDDLQRVLRSGDTVITESLSRLSRSSQDLLNILNEWQERGVIFISIKEKLDMSSSVGKLLVTVMAALSQFERDVIRERVLEGLSSARSRGRIGGRPRTEQANLRKALKLYEAKVHTVAEIQNLTGVSRSVLYRALKAESVNKPEIHN